MRLNLPARNLFSRSVASPRLPAAAGIDPRLTSTNRAERMSLKDPVSAEAVASIDGALASLDDAAAAAARLLARSRQPSLQASAQILTERGRPSRSRNGSAESSTTCIQRRCCEISTACAKTRIMLTTPGEARVRADLLLLVGAGLTAAWPNLIERLLVPPAKPEGTDVKRRIVWLVSPNPTRQFLASTASIEVFAAGLGVTLAANLAAHCARGSKARPVAQTQISLPALAALAGTCEARALRRCGLDAAASLGALEIEMLHGLVRDLNRNHPFLDFAGRRAGQWRGGSDGLRMGNRLPDANPDSAAAPQSMTRGGSMPSDPTHRV